MSFLTSFLGLGSPDEKTRVKRALAKFQEEHAAEEQRLKTEIKSIEAKRKRDGAIANDLRKKKERAENSYWHSFSNSDWHKHRRHSEAYRMGGGSLSLSRESLTAHQDRADAFWRFALRDMLDDNNKEPLSFFAVYELANNAQRAVLLEEYTRYLGYAHPSNRCPTVFSISSMSPELRAMFLPVFIGAEHAKNTFDQLDFDKSDLTAKRFVYRGHGGVPDLDHWRSRLPEVNAILGGDWRVSRGDGPEVVLTSCPDIPEQFRLDKAWLRRGEVFLGLNLNTGEPMRLPLDKLSHTLVVGPTGKGKSTFLHQFMASVTYNLDRFEAVHLVDLKFGLELMAYPGISGKFRLVDDPKSVPDLIDDLVAEMQRRGELMKKRRQTKWDGPLILLVVDEFASMFLATEQDKKARDALLGKLKLLLNLSRAIGIRVWFQSQAQTVDAIPGELRRNLTSLVSFQNDSNQSAAQLFGGIEAFPADIRHLRDGQVIYRDGMTSRMYALQGALVSAKDVTGW